MLYCTECSIKQVILFVNDAEQSDSFTPNSHLYFYLVTADSVATE